MMKNEYDLGQFQEVPAYEEAIQNIYNQKQQQNDIERNELPFTDLPEQRSRNQ